MNDRRFKLASGVLILAGVCGTAAAEPACHNGILSGGYGFTGTGSNAAGPVALVGRVVFDGHGNLTLVRTVSSNGTISRNVAGSGVYTVGANCRGTLTITSGVTAAQNYDMVLDTFGTQLRLIASDPGTMVTVEADKQFVGSGP